MNQVTILETISPAARELFENEGYEVEVLPSRLDPDTLPVFVADSLALGIRSLPSVPESVFETAPSLQAIGCFCIGTDQIDMQSAREYGVAVFNSKYENTRSVAELTIHNIIGLLRRTGEHNMSMHGGVWSKTEEDSYEVRGKTLGIVGYGSIGSQVSVLADSLGMNVRYYDPNPKMPHFGTARRVAHFDALLEQSDVISLHIPGTEETKNMINADILTKMKPGSYLINTARGDVVDYDALKEALESGHIKGAAIDVFKKPEPGKKGDAFDHVLRGLKNTILTPHIAGSTKESSIGIAQDASQKLINYLATGTSVGSVNIPELKLGEIPEGVTRILHIHENIPGADVALSKIISQEGLNVAAKMLQTKADIGYVAVDVEGVIAEAAIAAIKELKSTKRLRIIDGSKNLEQV